MNESNVNTIIDRYLQIVNIIGEPNEKYKYVAISHFQNNWNLEDVNFAEMFKTSFSKVSNLLYQNSWGFIYKCAENFPEEVRKMFKVLYDENQDLESRFSQFQFESSRLLPLLKDQLERDNINTQQDERTLSVYLGFRYPENYCIYKNSYFKSFVSEFDISSLQHKNSSFLTLQELLPTFRKVINQREDFIAQYRKFYPEPNWDDTNLMIQNLLYIIDKDDMKGIFNGVLNNFTKGNLVEYFRQLDFIIEDFDIKQKSQKCVFNVSENQLNFTLGQKYIWCLHSSKQEETFKIISEGQFGLKSEKFNSSINSYLNHIKDLDLLDQHQTNIDSAIQTVINKTVRSGYLKYNDLFIEKMAFDKDFRSLVLNVDRELFNYEDVKYWVFQGNPKFYDVVGALKSNVVTNWKVGAHKTKILSGDKIILWLTGENSGCYALGETTSNVGKLEMTDEEKSFYKTDFNEEEDRVGVKIQSNFCSKPILWKNIKDNLILAELNVGNQGTNFTATKEQYNELLRISQMDKNKMKHPLNQILFGCPGSGKTYLTKKLAVEIIEGRKIGDSKEEREEILELYNQYSEQKQIRFTTFHQSLSYEDFIEGIKPKLDKSDNGKLEYEHRDGLFKLICSDADLKKSSSNFEESYNKFLEEITEKGQITLNSIVKGTPFDVELNSNQNCVAIAHTEARTNMVISKKMIEEYVINNKEVLFWKTYVTSIGEYIKSEYGIAVENVDNQNKKYVLIMDEINRGNVSAIFGELITLIEDDKRKGCTEMISVDLRPILKQNFPYHKMSI